MPPSAAAGTYPSAPARVSEDCFPALPARSTACGCILTDSPDLLTQLQGERQALKAIEQELLQLAGRCGITRQAALERYLGHELDPHWLLPAGALPSPGALALASEHSERI